MIGLSAGCQSKRQHVGDDVFFFLLREPVFQGRHFGRAVIDDVEQAVMRGFSSVRQLTLVHALETRSDSLFAAVRVVTFGADILKYDLAAFEIAFWSLSKSENCQHSTG